MGARGEVVQELAPWASLPIAKAWLFGYVRTDVPGYREVAFSSITPQLAVVASSTGYRFDAYVSAYSTALQSVGGGAVTQTTKGQITGGGEPIDFLDRCGWVLGYGSIAGVTTDAEAPFVPPAGIPLMGATWDSVTTEVERRQIMDRHRRNQGFVWGASEVFRCVITMHRWSLQALETGWCLRGKVTIGGADKLSTPVGLSDPDGQITGYVLGVDGVEWLDQTQTYARVTMSIVKE